ncbi:hypothetical protein CK203_046008 [Vitis vinifera]|uniref:Uncharacterized protein n=1 Tax=Vitis vinifera TaxID=29760 RepID=A0A438HGW3_VITVI|nr:hypothetical protein CK203_046008 [Vitis vinifera]
MRNLQGQNKICGTHWEKNQALARCLRVGGLFATHVCLDISKIRRKIGYLHGTIKKPKEIGPTLHAWDASYSIVYGLASELDGRKHWRKLHELDEVWGRVLGTKLLSSIDEIFAEVRREECRKRVMLEEQKPLPR